MSFHGHALPSLSMPSLTVPSTNLPSTARRGVTKRQGRGEEEQDKGSATIVVGCNCQAAVGGLGRRGCVKFRETRGRQICIVGWRWLAGSRSQSGRGRRDRRAGVRGFAAVIILRAYGRGAVWMHGWMLHVECCCPLLF